jgi:hypothetical protein
VRFFAPLTINFKVLRSRVRANPQQFGVAVAAMQPTSHNGVNIIRFCIFDVFDVHVVGS